MRRPEHSHPCRNTGCTNRIGCTGTYERNHDGSPEVICWTYHHHHRGEMECEACYESRCQECGSVTRIEPHDTDCSKAESPAKRIADQVWEQA